MLSAVTDSSACVHLYCRFQIGLPLQLLLSAGSRSYDYVVIESRRQPIETQEPSAALIGSAIRVKPEVRRSNTCSGSTHICTSRSSN